MKKFLLIYWCASLVSAAFGEEPAELVSVRASYQKQIQAATEPINARYLSFLDDLKRRLGGKGDVEGALAVQKEMDAIAAVSKASERFESDKIVIRNQNNNGKGDRGTKKVNISLLAAGREVWSRKAVRVEWDAIKEGFVEVSVPRLTADTIRVEITEAVNDRGGLSEIEFIRGGKNIAKLAEVKTSAVWENNPKHAGSTLTDGVPGTYWLLPDNQEGWVEITLKP
ncbi:MAG: hypothetical protein IPK32_19770 [Verrucomicrobiaceae bacterium]|nr:hypothetical protein [Verrucomicrobiaceae bacterium]